MALACEKPDEQSNLPLSHWSQSELAREAVRRGIVDSISHGSVGRILKRSRPQAASRARLADPQIRTLSSTPSAPTSARVYHDASAAAPKDVRTVSVDEMTGVQALERAAPDLPMQPGKVARREFEYIRHGTQTLIAAFDVVTGQVIGTVGDTRTEQDYASFLETLFATGRPTTVGTSSPTISTPTSQKAWSAWSPRLCERR